MPMPTRSSDWSMSSACCLVMATIIVLRLTILCYRPSCRLSGKNSLARLHDQFDGPQFFRDQAILCSKGIITRQALQVLFVQMIVDVFRQVSTQLPRGEIHLRGGFGGDGIQVTESKGQ